jgi:hypothetical protein
LFPSLPRRLEPRVGHSAGLLLCGGWPHNTGSPDLDIGYQSESGQAQLASNPVTRSAACPCAAHPAAASGPCELALSERLHVVPGNSRPTHAFNKRQARGIRGTQEMHTLTTSSFRIALLALVLVHPLQALGGSRSSEISDWRSFFVPTFGTKVEYPAGIFSVSEGESEIGIGERFSTADGRAILSIYSRANEAGETPSTYLRTNLRIPRSAIEYERVTRSFFAISTVRDGTIYYSRCNFSSNSGSAIHCFDLMYPETEKKAWDDVVTRISRSLRPL